MKDEVVAESTDGGFSAKDSAEMEELCDFLNQIRQVTVPELVKHILKMKILLSKPGMIGECVDMNGVVSLVSIIKEFGDYHVQRPALDCIAICCTSKRAAIEVFESQAANIFVFALESDHVWQESLLCVVKSLRSAPERVAELLFNEGLYKNVAFRIAMCKKEEVQLNLLESVMRTLDQVEDVAQLGPVFAALKKLVHHKLHGAVNDEVAKLLEFSCSIHGHGAFGQIKGTGLGEELHKTKNKNLIGVFTQLEEDFA